MELIKQLENLKATNNFTKEEILKITSIENLFFVVTEAQMSQTPNYNNLYSLFETIRELMFEQEGLNVFEEFLTIKYYYLNAIYDLNTIVLEAIMEIIGPVLLDYELERRFFKDNEFYTYYLSRYNQFKQNNELSILRLVNKINLNDLKTEGENLEKVLKELKVTAGLQ